MFQDHFGNAGQWVRENEKAYEDIPELVDVIEEQKRVLEATKDDT